jgi:YgiT-type zinc finger domain-containing protein
MKKAKEKPDMCPECGGAVRPGHSEMVYDLQYRVRIDNVPAHICSQCGEVFIDGSVAFEVNRLVNRVIEDVESFAKTVAPRNGVKMRKEIAVAV